MVVELFITTNPKRKLVKTLRCISPTYSIDIIWNFILSPETIAEAR